MSKSKLKTRKVCVVTGTRAEYGLLKLLCRKINESKILRLQLVVTGSHLSELHGLTYREIEEDGFNIDWKVDLKLENDSASEIANATSRSIKGISECFEALTPDMIIVLGDRYELFGPTIAALFHGIVVSHIHGGELTEGAIDESIRHCLTKMSHLHFVATEEYRKRVIQLGEQPQNVFNFGGLGVDAIHSCRLLDKRSLERRMGIRFQPKNLLVTFHPETLAEGDTVEDLRQLLNALSIQQDSLVIFTMPNADPGYKPVFQLINDFILENSTSRVAFSSLGQLQYFSMLQFVDGVIGNSSSGLLEVPSFKKGTINIGDRQKGRIRAQSVIDCEPDSKSILSAIEQMLSHKFKQRLETVENPYGLGGASDSIVRVLESIQLNSVRKKFNDLDFRFES